MTYETIIGKVQQLTGIQAARVTTIIGNAIDEVQDSWIVKNIHNHKWSWLDSRSALDTIASYSTGTVTVTQDSTSIVGATVAWDTSMIGSVIRIEDEDEYYTIIGVAGSTITIDEAYIGTSGSLKTYEIVKVYYELESNVKNILWMKQVVSPKPVIPVAPLPFNRLLPDEFTSTGEIAGYILSGIGSTSKYVKVRFTPIPKVRKRVYYGYLQKFGSCSGAGLVSSIPDDLHNLFVHKLSEFVYNAYDLPTKAEAESKLFDSLLWAAIKDDKDIQMDDENVMEDEILISSTGKTPPQLPDNYPRIY